MSSYNQITAEVTSLRREYIEGQVTRKINHRNGDASTQQVEQWEAEACARWNEMYPSLAAVVVEGGQS